MRSGGDGTNIMKVMTGQRRRHQRVDLHGWPDEVEALAVVVEPQHEGYLWNGHKCRSQGRVNTDSSVPIVGNSDNK